jgi:hypothetical protein
MNRVLSLGSAILFLATLGACEQKGPLKVDDVDPGQGTTGGGDHVVIRGSGFEPGKTQVDVRFGRRKVENVTISSANKIMVVTPPGERGPVDVTLMFDNGAQFKIPQGFRYVPPAAGDDVRKAFFSKDQEEK